MKKKEVNSSQTQTVGKPMKDILIDTFENNIIVTYCPWFCKYLSKQCLISFINMMFLWKQLGFPIMQNTLISRACLEPHKSSQTVNVSKINIINMPSLD